MTMDDIAKLAGVSRGTVDRVIHNRGRVAPDVKQRVEQIMQEVDYRPSKAAQRLAMHNLDRNIGFLCRVDLNGFWSIVVSSVAEYEQELREYGIRIIRRYFDYCDPEAQLRMIDELAASDISALVIVPLDSPIIAARLRELSEGGLPIVLLNSDVEGINPLCYVGSDYYVGGQTAAGLMLQFRKGPLQILMFNGSPYLSSHRLRREGFLEELKAAGADPVILESGDITSDPEYAYQQALQLLRSRPEVNAVYTVPDNVAAVGRAIADLGLIGHVTHIGYGMTDATRPYILNGAISALVGQRAADQGVQSFRILLDYFTSGSAPAKPRLLMLNDIFIKQNSVF